MFSSRLFKKRNVIILAISIVVAVACSGFYYFDRVKSYYDLISSGDKAAASDNFDRAINLYTQAETYRKNSKIDGKIKLAGILKSSKASYDKAVKEMKDKNYLGAVDMFKKMDNHDTKRYKASKNNIEQCRNLYVSDNLSKARASFKNNDFDNADKYLANVFKLDADNKDAKSIKSDIAKAVQEHKEETAKVSAAQANSIPKNEDDNYTPQMAIKLAMEKDELKNSPDLLTYCNNIPEYDSNGEKYFHVFFKKQRIS